MRTSDLSIEQSMLAHVSTHYLVHPDTSSPNTFRPLCLENFLFPQKHTSFIHSFNKYFEPFLCDTLLGVWHIQSHARKILSIYSVLHIAHQKSTHKGCAISISLSSLAAGKNLYLICLYIKCIHTVDPPYLWVLHTWIQTAAYKKYPGKKLHLY